MYSNLYILSWLTVAMVSLLRRLSFQYLNFEISKDSMCQVRGCVESRHLTIPRYMEVKAILEEEVVVNYARS